MVREVRGEEKWGSIREAGKGELQWARGSGENWGCKNLRRIEEMLYGFSECEVNKVKIIRLFKKAYVSFTKYSRQKVSLRLKKNNALKF